MFRGHHPGEQSGVIRQAAITADDFEHAGEPDARVVAVELGGFDDRIERGSRFATGIGPGEQPVLAADRNGLSILPTSGRMLTSTTAGTLCMVAVSGCKAANRAAMAVSMLSSQRPVTSRYCRNGCWTRSSVRAWKWERLGSRWTRSSTFSVS
jgi:hypothetical protein